MFTDNTRFYLLWSPVVRELDYQGTTSYILFIFLAAGYSWVVELDRLCEVNNLYCAQERMIVSRTGSIYGKAPKRQFSYIVLPLLSLEMPTPEIKFNSLKLSSVYKSPPHKRFLVEDAAHSSCDSPDTSRRFALFASNVCLVGENPTCSVLA